MQCIETRKTGILCPTVEQGITRPVLSMVHRYHFNEKEDDTKIIGKHCNITK
jgi:hypothetical protein